MFRPIYYSRGNRYMCHRKKIFKIFKHVCLFCTMEFRNDKVMLKNTKCEISAESDNFIFRPIFYSKGNRIICHGKKNFKIFKKKIIAKWSLRMKRGCQKKLNAKYQLNPVTSSFVLFYIPEETAIYVIGRKLFYLIKIFQIFSNF